MPNINNRWEISANGQRGYALTIWLDGCMSIKELEQDLRLCADEVLEHLRKMQCKTAETEP
jgi:hypothetical protein